MTKLQLIVNTIQAALWLITIQAALNKKNKYRRFSKVKLAYIFKNY